MMIKSKPRGPVCLDCNDEGYFYDDGEYDPRSRHCHGGRKVACRTCLGKGTMKEEER